MSVLTEQDPVVIVHAGGFLNINFALGSRFIVYLSGNVTGTGATNHAVRDVRQIMFVQDATGGRTVTWTENASWRYPRGLPVIDTDPSAVGSPAGRTVVNMARLDSSPTQITVIDVPKPDRRWYAVELAVLLANAGVPISDASKANLLSPAFLGTPTAPTAAPATNTTQVSTTAFVQAAIAALLNSAPGALDTLDELAAALGDDANFAATVTTALAGKQPLAAHLTTLAALTAVANVTALADQVTAADKLSYWTGAGAAGLADLTPVARTLLAQTTQALMRSTGLGLGDISTLNLSSTFAWTGSHVFTHTTGDTAPITIVSTDDGAAAGPRFDLYRNSPTPAALDNCGSLRFRGNDAGGNLTSYAAVNGTILDTTDGSEDGRLDFTTQVAGASGVRFSIGAGIHYNGGVDMGVSTINTQKIYLNGGVFWSSGAGTPEGVVTAPIGSLFTRTDGAAATTLYVKTSGAGNTGWTAK